MAEDAAAGYSIVSIVLALASLFLVGGLVLFLSRMVGRRGATSECTTHDGSLEGSMLMENGQEQKVVVRDIKMGFGSMVVFMIKWTLASIPALIILGVLGLVVGSVAGGIFAGLLR
jgi:hypothetical protein